MSVRATLHAPGSNNYRVLRFNYEFSQAVDANMVPIAVPRGGKINFVIESPRQTGILAWMLGTDRPSAGTLTVIDGDLSTIREIRFEGGHCVSFREEYDSYNGNPMIIHFTVACQFIEINDQPHNQITWTEQSSSARQGSSSSTASTTSEPASALGNPSGNGEVSSFNPNDGDEETGLGDAIGGATDSATETAGAAASDAASEAENSASERVKEAMEDRIEEKVNERMDEIDSALPDPLAI